MKVNKTKIPGVFIIDLDVFFDERGALIKTFNKDDFAKHGLKSSLDQSLCSISKKGVIRGMHFQTPPKEQVKAVYVVRGSITDVVLDIRKGSPSYGEYVAVELSETNHKMIYVPAGCAHGFVSHEDNTNVIYLQDIVQAKENEGCINIDSFGMNWDVSNPIVSQKDRAALGLKDFDPPFIYTEQKYENIN